MKMRILEQTGKAQDAELPFLNRKLAEEKRLTMQHKEKMLQERDKIIRNQMRLNVEKSEFGQISVEVFVQLCL